MYIYIYYGLLPYNVINHDISYIHHNYIMLYSLSPTRDPSKRPAAPTKKPSRCSAGRRPLLRRSRRCSGCGSCRSSWTNRSPQPKSATGTAWRWTVGFCHGKNGDRKRKSHRTPCLNMFVKSWFNPRNMRILGMKSWFNLAKVGRNRRSPNFSGLWPDMLGKKLAIERSVAGDVWFFQWIIWYIIHNLYELHHSLQ